MEVDELEAGAAAHQLVESLVTHVEAALGGETWSEETLHITQGNHLGNERVEQRTALSQGGHPRGAHHLTPGEVHTHELRIV